MGVKISALPQNALPYSGSEEFPLVQGLETKAGTLSSLINYLSGDFAFYNRNNNFTQSQSISGNLTVTGEISATVFNAVSANFSVIDIKQYELSGFNITGNLSATGNAIFQGSLSALGGGTFRGPGIFETTSTQDALRVTQRGTGRAIVVEDSENPDTTSLSIDTSGRVVIGALSSVYGGKCEIYSDSSVGPWVALKQYANNADGSYFAFVKTRGDTPESNVSVSQDDNLGTINFQGTDGTRNRVASYILGEVDGIPQPALSSVPGRLVFATTLSGLNYSSERMRITNAGNVGIGTTAPNERLTVIGNISATGSITTSNVSVIDTSSSQDALRVTQRGAGMALRVEDETNVDSTPFVVTSTGVVGIGTDAPNEKLTVIGNISATSGIITSGTGIIDTSSPLAALRVTQRGTGNALVVEDEITPDSTSFVITSAGSVGIGINTPNEKLTIVGNTSATGVAYTRELDFGSSERPSLTGIKQALNSFLYVAPALSYVRVNGSSSASLEVGQALTAPAITWTSNKVEAAAVSNYLLTLPTSVTSTGSNTFTFSAFNDTNTYNITTLPGTNTQATSAWSVRVTDWANAQSTSSVTATWRYRVYYGAISQATPTDAQVMAGTEASTLATSRTGLGSYTATPNNEYMFVAYPSRFGATSQFRVNGLPNTAFTLVTINTFTNAYGGTAQYFVYRSDNLLTGTYTIEII